MTAESLLRAASSWICVCADLESSCEWNISPHTKIRGMNGSNRRVVSDFRLLVIVCMFDPMLSVTKAGSLLPSAYFLPNIVRFGANIVCKSALSNNI